MVNEYNIILYSVVENQWRYRVVTCNVEDVKTNNHEKLNLIFLISLSHGKMCYHQVNTI